MLSSLSFIESSWFEEDALHIPAASVKMRVDILMDLLLQPLSWTVPVSSSFRTNLTPPPFSSIAPQIYEDHCHIWTGNYAVDPIVEDHKQALHGLRLLVVDVV